jgi:hypothetical protein
VARISGAARPPGGDWGTGVWVECSGCGATLGHQGRDTGDFNTDDEAVAAWNLRP